MSENKTCKQCQKEFKVLDEDLFLYKKISPELGGRTYEISSPTFCPDCRMQRLLAWRNERNLYKRKCDLCHKDIISVYSPDKPYIVYCQKCYWSDDSDSVEFGFDYDFNRTFIEQFRDLQSKVPRICLLSKNSENSEYTNHAGNSKNCYLSFICFNCENAFYSRKVFNSKDVYDCFLAFEDCENIYDCAWSYNVSNSAYLVNCHNVRDCYFCEDLRNCHDCFLSSNLRGKSYYFRNQPLSEADYKSKVNLLLNGSWKDREDLKKEFKKIKERDTIYKYLHIQNSENCTGDYIESSKDIYQGFDITGCENSRYVMEIDNGGYNRIGCKDCIDCFGMGGAELNYEVHSQSVGYHNIATNFSYDIRQCLYCDNCNNCESCFGCVGLKNKKYCIFNKQYSKEEYENLAGKIIEKMIEEKLWGEFFPMKISPYGYNETFANHYWEKTKEEAQKIGAKWQDDDFSLQFSGEFYQPQDNIAEYINSEENREALLSGVLKCESLGKPYKILPSELAFYIKNRIPIPRKSFEARLKEKHDLINVAKFYHRKCMCDGRCRVHQGSCPNEFETTYASARPERVYCEQCYEKAVQ